MPRTNYKNLWSIWKRSANLGWPVTVDHVLRTMMRTVDIIVTGLFSPAAISAIGIADLYARIPLRIGHGLGAGAIALSSQDTGTGAQENRNEAITQAILSGAILGIPFVLFGLLFGYSAVAILGAPHQVAQMGGIYLAIIFATAPARHVALVGARSLQGIGDTVTPMKINIGANLLNIILTVSLGLGLWIFPRMAIIGVGIGTAFGNIFAASCFILAIAMKEEISFVVPRDLIIFKQIIAIGAPKTLEGLATTAAEFPFNSILLMISVEANAAWQIGRRLYQQLTAPPARAGNVVSSIIIGQSLGANNTEEARFNGWAIGAFGVLVIGPLGLLMVVFSEPLVRIFTSDSLTVDHATQFVTFYGLAATFEALFRVLAGALQGAGETRVPFIAEFTGIFVFFVGFSYYFGIYLGLGVFYAYLSILLYNVWRLGIVLSWFYKADWVSRAASMMESRDSL